MSVNLEVTDWDGIADHVYDRINFGDWWVFDAPWDDNWIFSAVEETYYTGEANGDFDLLICPNGPIACAHKRHMTQTQFAELLDVEPSVLDGKDIISFFPEEAK